MKAQRQRSRTQNTSVVAARQSGPVILLVCLALVALTWLVFGQTLRHGFVNYDDPSYVYENPTVIKGLTLEGLKWAFTHSHARNWHPLTTLSHVLDCQLFGVEPGGHHFTNVLLHTVTVLLLFFLLWQMTGAYWRSAFVAAIFAIHPLRVESVAWVAERKDVLSGLFFVLTLAAYVRYVRKRTITHYSMVALFFALGLMSKPMLVTLPLVLLLVDYWPLGRFAQSRSNRSQSRTLLPLLVEKVPLLVLSAASCLVTFLVQKSGGAQTEPLPLTWRIGNALTAYVTYIWQMIWPINLAPIYPHPEGGLPAWLVVGAMLILLIVTGTAFLRRRKNPYVLTGWLWYLGMLVPVIGIVQVGAQGWADRYTYLPQIGLYVLVTWTLADVTAGWRYRRELLGAGGALAVAALGWTAWVQTGFWRNSETLWTHTLAVTTENEVAHNNLGEVLDKRDQIDEALSHYEKALEIRSHKQTSRYDFLLALTHSNLGTVLRRKGLLNDAIDHYRKAVELQPDYAEGYFGLGGALTEKGWLDGAIDAFRKALTLEPEYAGAYIGLGTALLRAGRPVEAIVQYQKALELAPQALVALNNLAWVYATSADPSIRNGPKAVLLAEQAVRVTGQDPFYLHKLAAAYAAVGDFPKALETAERALQSATRQGDAALAGELERNILLYQANTALTDTRQE
ncbi:MAG: protein O-mannosyl-transferase [Verrucomicrobiota bacterium]